MEMAPERGVYEPSSQIKGIALSITIIAFAAHADPAMKVLLKR